MLNSPKRRFSARAVASQAVPEQTGAALDPETAAEQAAVDTRGNAYLYRTCPCAIDPCAAEPSPCGPGLTLWA